MTRLSIPYEIVGAILVAAQVLAQIQATMILCRITAVIHFGGQRRPLSLEQSHVGHGNEIMAVNDQPRNLSRSSSHKYGMPTDSEAGAMTLMLWNA